MVAFPSMTHIALTRNARPVSGRYTIAGAADIIPHEVAKSTRRIFFSGKGEDAFNPFWMGNGDDDVGVCGRRTHEGDRTSR
jgi:hypothetical protein